MKTNIFRDGRVHVKRRMCETCIFGANAPISKKRLAAMVRSATKAKSTIVCHKTLIDETDHAACHGFFKHHATQPLQLAERLGFIEYDE